jgi:hypothetical protein
MADAPGAENRWEVSFRLWLRKWRARPVSATTLVPMSGGGEEKDFTAAAPPRKALESRRLGDIHQRFMTL